MNNSEKRKLKLERRRKIEKDRSVNEFIAKKTVSVDKSMFGIETPKRPKDFYQRQRRLEDEKRIIAKQERADRLKFLAEKAKKNKAGGMSIFTGNAKQVEVIKDDLGIAGEVVSAAKEAVAK